MLKERKKENEEAAKEKQKGRIGNKRGAFWYSLENIDIHIFLKAC